MLRTAVLLLALIAILAPGTSEAAFTAPEEISGCCLQSQVGVDADGDALIVWMESDLSFYRVRARARSAAGVLGPAETLSPAPNASDGRVAVNTGGDALVAWRSRGDGGPCSSAGCYRIRARARAAAGGLGVVQTLSPAGQNADQPQVAIDGSGDALAVWRRGDGTGTCHSFGCYRIQARARSAAGTLGPVQTLSGAGEDAGDAQVVIGADGHALVVWARPDGAGSCTANGCYRIQARARAADGTLGPLQTLSAPGQSANAAQIAIDANGNSLVVWRFEGSSSWQIQARADSAAGVLGSVQNLSAAGAYNDLPQVAIDADGNALVVWRSLTDDGAVRARARSAAGVLGSVQTLSPPGKTDVPPQVASEADGDAVVVWGRYNGGGCNIYGCIRAEARTRSAAGVLGPVQTLSASEQHAWNVQVAAAADAFALATWTYGPSEDCGCARIQAAAGP